MIVLEAVRPAPRDAESGPRKVSLLGGFDDNSVTAQQSSDQASFGHRRKYWLAVFGLEIRAFRGSLTAFEQTLTEAEPADREPGAYARFATGDLAGRLGKGRLWFDAPHFEAGVSSFDAKRGRRRQMLAARAFALGTSQ